jgi:hypothetical protein
MAFLRRILTIQASLWGILGAVMTVVPRWAVETVAAQPPLPDDTWLRVLGVMAIVLALLMVLVSQRLEDVWWWAWAFVVLEAGTATVFAVHVLIGLPPGVAIWPWWLLALANGAIGALELVGLGLTAQEKPFA